ncbi:hypothetical protein [Mesonia sp. K7]|uniref:hypothetical protein n=1 Tax=Mesonia sp. K7 TaxID=2218606 RepID=UPI001314AB34|nr:hypothetical protein [Mesonia sp. K7]
MKNKNKILIGILIVGSAMACTPEQLPTEKKEVTPLSTDTGDDESLEPDNERDG